MKLTKYTIIIAFIFTAMLVVISGCDYSGERNDNMRPSIQIYNNPADGDTLGAAPIIYWQSFDTDGKVYKYFYIDLPFEQDDMGIDADDWDMYHDNPALLADIDSLITLNGQRITWTRTESTSDTVFLQLLVPDEVTKHLFCVRGQDTEDMYSDIVCKTFYRSNIPPDSCTIVTDPFDGEEFWILDDTIYSWGGIEVNWTGDDPDNSIILEFYWWLEDVVTSEIVLTSLFEDSLGGINSGYDPYDGWVRNVGTKLRGEVSSGEYYFIVQVRDDAFIAGASDTATITLAHPYFDISDTLIRRQYEDGSFQHKVLIIDQNESILYVSDLQDVRDFYTDIFDRFDVTHGNGMIERYDLRTSGYTTLEVPRIDLAEFSILYVLDQEYLIGSKMSASFLEELLLYVQVGGRIICDGRNVFTNEDETWEELPTYDYFGIEEDVTGSATKIFDRAIPNEMIAGYPALTIDPDKTWLNTTAISTVNRIGMRESFGMPYTQRLYSFGINDEATPQDSVDFDCPVAVRYVSPSFRTAYFAFPLYLMDNNEDQVKEVIESTIEFIKEQVAYEQDTTETI